MCCWDLDCVSLVKMVKIVKMVNHNVKVSTEYALFFKIIRDKITFSGGEGYFHKNEGVEGKGILANHPFLNVFFSKKRQTSPCCV